MKILAQVEELKADKRKAEVSTAVFHVGLSAGSNTVYTTKLKHSQWRISLIILEKLFIHTLEHTQILLIARVKRLSVL